MPRSPRRNIVFPGEIYHVYARGNDKMPLFLTDEDFRFYLENVLEFKQQYNIDIFHYAIMPNHVHFLLRPREEGLSKFMQAIQDRFAKRFCLLNSFVGHVWQSRFKSKRVEDEDYLMVCGQYIELNPIRAGLTAKPDEWQYSSYRAYAYGEPDELVTFDPVYLGLGNDPAARQAAYRQQMEG